MADTTLAKIVLHLQYEYLRTGKNDSVKRQSLIPTLGISEVQLHAALQLAIDLGGQMLLEQVGYDSVRLGRRAIRQADARKAI